MNASPVADPLPSPPPTEAKPAGKLSLGDAISIIVGIVIGTTIFQSPPLIMNNVSGPWMGLGVWALAGLLSMIGALCYAELASTYPQQGGDYAYLSRAYHPALGFLFGWAQLVAVLTGSIGAMAFVFGDYAVRLWPDGPLPVVHALLSVLLLTLLNLLGVVLGKWTQNVLSIVKLIGLGVIVLAALFWGGGQIRSTDAGTSSAGFGLAMILVLYAYGGWNDAAFVAAEMRERRQIGRALILGTLVVTLVYLAVNVAYLLALGFDGVRQSRAVAADALALLPGKLGQSGEVLMCLLVMVSALGAINGMIFTGARVYAALGQGHALFTRLGHWHPRWRSPIGALLAQASVALLMIVSVGTATGRDFLDALFRSLTLPALPWEQYYGGFDTLVAGTSPVFWGFFLLTGISLFILRRRDPHLERPFRVPLYPVLPLIFCGTCAYMLYQSILYASGLVLLGVLPLLAGLLLYLCSSRTGQH